MWGGNTDAGKIPAFRNAREECRCESFVIESLGHYWSDAGINS